MVVAVGPGGDFKMGEIMIRVAWMIGIVLPVGRTFSRMAVVELWREERPVKPLGTGGQRGVVLVSPRAGDGSIRGERFPTPGQQGRAGLQSQQHERRGPKDEGHGPVGGPVDGGDHRWGGRNLATAHIAIEGHSGDGRQGSAVHRAAGIHCDGLIRKDRPLEDREGADDSRGADLPEDIPCLCATRKDNVNGGSHLEVGRDLENPDIIRTAGEGEVGTGDQRSACELIEAGGKVEAAEISSSRIEERTGGNGRSPGGVVEGRG